MEEDIFMEGGRGYHMKGMGMLIVLLDGMEWGRWMDRWMDGWDGMDG